MPATLREVNVLTPLKNLISQPHTKVDGHHQEP